MDSDDLMQGQTLEQESQTTQIPQLTMVGRSAAMDLVMSQLRTVAQIPYYPVLLTGETGVGKQEAATFLHEASISAPYKFVDVNCGAIPRSLLESELFGHVRGAFTGAISDKVGRLEDAQCGTLFLDEIGDASYAVQRALLKFLDNRIVIQVGGIKPKTIKTRVVAATRIDLLKAMEKGRFRDDLYHRLNTFSVHIPPLRDRPDDIKPLVLACIGRFNHQYRGNVRQVVPDEVVEKLKKYSWPGNIRQLFTIVERAAIHCRGGVIRSLDIDLPEDQGDLPSSVSIGGPYTANQVEKAHIEGVLKNNRYNKKRTAEILGIYRATFYKRMKRLGIQGGHELEVAEEETERARILKALGDCRWHRKKAAERLGMNYHVFLGKIKKYGLGADQD